MHQLPSLSPANFPFFDKATIPVEEGSARAQHQRLALAGPSGAGRLVWLKKGSYILRLPGEAFHLRIYSGARSVVRL